MKRILIIMLLGLSDLAWATTYYVSSSTGNDANGGTAAAPWQTIAHVNGQTFQPGDSILFKRGDVWNESLAPASSGSSGNPITFDAYGSGAAPTLTGYYAVPSAAWVQVTGNAWKAPVPATYSTINFCLFGSVWGQKVAAVSSNLTAQWDFYLANGYVYVYSVGNPATFYNEPIVPMALSNLPVININGQSWLTFQHFLVNWFDDYGVYVQGTSDHLVFANMEADSMIPQGTQPLGFYVNENAPGPGDIKIYNSEAHLNYDGFRFDGAATAITMVNDKAYANRDGALVDNTSAVSYSYCHFYASSLAVAGSTDVEYTSGTGPIAGLGNIAADTAPAVLVYQRYPAQVTLTVDDAGMTAGADTYYASQVLPIADAAGVPVGAAITVGYALAQTLISEFQGWINGGRDVTSHSISHTYYTNTDALDLQYTGSGTAATLSISNKTLTITVTGASDSVSYNLAQGQAEGTIKSLRLALLATGKFTATENPVCQGPYGTGCSAYTESALLSQDLADVSGQNVKSAIYSMQLDTTRLTTDEITLSRQWMTTNLTGLPVTPVYVYPGGYETTAMQGITGGVPYSGARGALKEDLGVKDTYADGFNVQNITSFGVNPSWMGLPPAVLNQKIEALVWKESVWGVPWGIFWHLNELTNTDPVGGTEITNLIQDFKASGATIQTNTSLVNWLLSGTQETGSDGIYYYKFPATSMALDFRPTNSSPVVDAGENLGTAYALDINGVNQNSYGSGWEIGAHVYEGYAMYGGGTGSGRFVVGSQLTTSVAQLPLIWVDNNEATDGLVYPSPQYELNLQTQAWVSGAPAGCTFHVPYWTVGTPTSTGLQAAVNDIEACRTQQAAGTILDIPPALYSGASGLVIPQSNTVPASVFLMLRSTADASLPAGSIVCAHDIGDNLATLTGAGLNNPDCTGQNMYYTLGPTLGNNQAWLASPCNTEGVLCGLTTVSVNSTTLAAITASGSAQLANLANGYVSAMLQGTGTACVTVDTGANQECVTPLSGSGVTGTVTTSGTTITCVTGCPFSTSWTGAMLIDGTSYDISTTTPCTTTTCTMKETVHSTISPAPFAYGWNEFGLYGVFSKNHSSGACVVYNTTGCGGTITNGTGAFSLANGVATNTSAYNDLQYMWQVQCANSSTACVPLETCSPVGTGSSVPQCTGTTIAPDHWLIEDGAFSTGPGNPTDVAFVRSVTGGNETSTSQYVSHMHYRKIWSHGDWTSLQTGGTSTVDAFALYGSYISIVDSQGSQNLRPGSEGHSVGMDGPGPYKIVHNWFEGQSSCMFAGGFGGGTGPPVPGMVPNQDVERRRNRCTFPFTWLGQMRLPASNPMAPENIVRKNVEENKEGERVLDSGNIYENTDNSGGQGGPCGNDNIRNNSGSAGTNYQATINDYNFENDIFRNCIAAFGLGGRSVPNPNDGGGVSQQMQRMNFSNDLWYSVTTSGPGYGGANSNTFGIASDGESFNVTLTEDATGSNARATALYSQDAGSSYTVTATSITSNVLTVTTSASTNFVPGLLVILSGTGEAYLNGQALIVSAASGTFFTGAFTAANYSNPSEPNSASASSSIPIASTAITAASITSHVLTVTSNLYPVAGETIIFPAGAFSSGDPAAVLNNQTFVVTGSSSTSFTAPAAGFANFTSTASGTVEGPVGFQSMGFSDGEPVYIAGCAGTSAFNFPEKRWGAYYYTAGIISQATSESALTITFPNAFSGVAANTTDATGSCVLTNVLGGPQSLALDHLTIVSDGAHTILVGNSLGSVGPNNALNGLVRDNILIGSNECIGQGDVGTGTTSEEYGFDVPISGTTPSVNGSTSIDHDVCPLDMGSEYTEYSSNLKVPTDASCNLINNPYGCSPPVSMYFPPAIACSGTVNAGCVGFLGGVSPSLMPLTLPDYHNFALSSTSSFYAGQSAQASDGTSMGTNIPAIDAAQVLNQYVCKGACGSPGPFPDTVH